MPKKVRQLKQELRKAGFLLVAGMGKGSHSLWRHERHTHVTVLLSGKDGSDARRHLEQKVEDAIKTVRRLDQETR